ncbi:hypothetical protein [Carnobacterium maltaromaticum]|uniref:hypothetical protein n=1 Tax=Carnobacterium maltaromaticum TaxID=2751 RepID=UPI0012FA4795|nr:hypothetical protein [Carnobacterium maltaromaticum]
MKKNVLCGLLVGLSFLVGCSSLTTEKESSKNSESSIVQETEKNGETPTKLNKQKIQEVLVAYQSLHVFEDNMIGNITYNFTDAMSDEDFTVIHEVIDVYYLSLKKGIVERHEAAKLELDRLGFEKEALEDFLQTEEKIAGQQTEWSTKMVGFTKENAMELKKEIADNQLAYQLDSQESGYKLLNLLKSAGMSEDEAREMMKTIILEAMKLYGDQQDVEQINSRE